MQVLCAGVGGVQTPVCKRGGVYADGGVGGVHMLCAYAGVRVYERR